jgi:hypothetical protein
VFYHFLVSSSSVLIKIKMYPTFFCCPPKLMKLSTISDRGTSAMVDRKPPCLLVLISIVLRLVLLTTNLSVSTRVRFQLPLFESDVADVSCPHARASAMDMAIKLCARAFATAALHPHASLIPCFSCAAVASLQCCLT